MCRNQGLELLAVRSIHIELFARWLEHQGAAQATIGSRLSTVTGFYRCWVEEELLTRNQAVNVRHPQLRQESTMSDLDRNELGAFLVHAAISSARDQALACLLGLNGQDHPTQPAMGGWGCDHRPYGSGLVVMYLWKAEWSV